MLFCKNCQGRASKQNNNDNYYLLQTVVASNCSSAPNEMKVMP